MQYVTKRYAWTDILVHRKQRTGAQSVMKLTRAFVIFVDISSTEFDQNRMKNVDIADKISFMPLGEVRISLYKFSRNPQRLNHITWRSSVSNFIGIGQEAWKVRVEIYLRT